MKKVIAILLVVVLLLPCVTFGDHTWGGDGSGWDDPVLNSPPPFWTHGLGVWVDVALGWLHPCHIVIF